MSRRKNRVHQCACELCQQHPHSALAQHHQSLNRVLAQLDEKSRRRVLGLLASRQPHGGLHALHQITGLSCTTIRRGREEVQRLDPNPGIRAAGGGRKAVEKKHPAILKRLVALVRDATAGDPIKGTKWTRKTVRELAHQLSGKAYQVSHETVRRLLQGLEYSLHSNRKHLSRTHDPDRDRQMRYIARQRRAFRKTHNPVISVDTKKKELVGHFKNTGRTWRRHPLDVLATDFPSAALGKAIPYGIYDVARNRGFVVVGTSHETAQFAVAAIRRWWLQVGRIAYPQATHLLIQADAGGANSSRAWLWKLALQEFADEFHLTITVTHYPTSASKWNLIEHCLFNFITLNWAGQPLVSYETVLKFIRTTTTESGLRCLAYLDAREYPTQLKVTREQKASIRLKRHRVLPRWNYTIEPHQTPLGK